MADDLTFPRDLEFRLQRILAEDIDSRLKDLTLLVSLQETELSLLWYALSFVLVLQIVHTVKEHKNG